MKVRFNLTKLMRSALPLVALLLSACLSGGNMDNQRSPGSNVPGSSTGGGGSLNSYTIGGSVSGLVGTVVLQNNNGDNLSITASVNSPPNANRANGNFAFVNNLHSFNSIAASLNFVFATKVNDGAAYSVSVLTQPAGHICSVSTGAGTVTGINVNSVVVTCASSSHTVSGTVSGLGAHPLVLQNNGSDNLVIAANGTFGFATSVASGSAYNVSVLTQPFDRKCSVRNSSGTIAGSNITNVSVVCGHLQGGAIQGIPLSLVPTVSTFAGIAGMFADGIGAAARFNAPYASVSDGTNLYVVDSTNNNIRKIVIATGAVTTFAGSPTGVAGPTDGTGTAALFNSPAGITTDGTNLYVLDINNQKIRKIVIATGVVSSFTGTANTSMTGGAADGAATAATFGGATGITTDGTNLYVADMNNCKIRQIVIATGVVSSLTGAANTVMGVGALDGAGTAATFNYPQGITTDGISLYVTDGNNQKIRQIVIATGVVSSVTGMASSSMPSGALDGAGTAATFFGPSGITTDGTNLYVVDQSNQKIRQIVITTGVVSSLTGVASTAAATGKVNGAPASASFLYPTGVSYDSVHNSLFVADQNNNVLRQITLGASSTVSTLAGIMGPDGSGAVATFAGPAGATTDGSNLYLVDQGNFTIRKIVIATGAVTTLAGQTGVPGAADGTGTAATFNSPSDITTDGTNLYVVDAGNNKIRQIVIATGVVSSLTGAANTTVVAGAVDGAGSGASFYSPSGITTDGTNLYVADNSNNKIRQIVIASGVVSSLTGTASTAMGTGVVDGAGTAATFSGPVGITTDGTNLYVVDQGNQKIRQIVIATGVVSSLTGTASMQVIAGAVDGASTAARFNWPASIITDGTNLYVTDQTNHTIRQIVIATGAVSTLAGQAGVAGAVDGAGAAATFWNPYGIATDGSSLYVADFGNNIIRKIQ